ncbi:MAG TPA: SOS response-associated peptidase [Candidatus Saccharimonadales bacterium]|nr:SOS response-associated peptidase [Candidatus Saccharimonadales bacterium]
MCGRYTLFEVKDLGPRFNLAKQPHFVSKDNYNVAPRQWLPVIFEDEEVGRIAEPMQWGFIPVWAKDISKTFRPINTKSETVFDSNMWKGAVRHRRCIVPSRGFYEWKAVNEKMKVPYFIHPKDQKLFGFAGIYSIWHDVEDRPLYSFSILTTHPNKEMQPIHDRMPVILHPGQEASWLSHRISERDQLAEFLVPYEDNGLEIYKVSADVNSPRNNDKHLVEHVS